DVAPLVRQALEIALPQLERQPLAYPWEVDQDDGLDWDPCRPVALCQGARDLLTSAAQFIGNPAQVERALRVGSDCLPDAARGRAGRGGGGVVGHLRGARPLVAVASAAMAVLEALRVQDVFPRVLGAAHRLRVGAAEADRRDAG